MAPASTTSQGRARRGALLVGAGILVSRLAGLVRLQVFAHYFGLQSDAADAFNAAFRIPNFLQNLFGEGALSASFIPVYASLVARGERKEADRIAGRLVALCARGGGPGGSRSTGDAGAHCRYCARFHGRQA